MIYTGSFQSREDLKLQKEGVGHYTRPYWLALLNTWSNTLVSFTEDAKEFSTEYSLHRGLQFIEVLFMFFSVGLPHRFCGYLLFDYCAKLTVAV